ncbi:MAG: hypothetical protein HIU93_11205 [Acidobacteria bacterium]|nr:hypothetical protein [Acidobacteriota bacterium]
MLPTTKDQARGDLFAYTKTFTTPTFSTPPSSIAASPRWNAPQPNPSNFSGEDQAGQAMPESKREANGKVVSMVLKPLRASA